MFQYSGPQDPTRERSEELADSEVRARVRSFLLGNADITPVGHPIAFQADNPPDLVSLLIGFPAFVVAFHPFRIFF